MTSPSTGDGATIQRLRPALGTFVGINCRGQDQPTAEHAVECAFAAVRTVERLMHPSGPGSDLVAIHSSRPGLGIDVHPWTWAVLELSQRLNESSRGCFDPCRPDAPGRMSDLSLPVPGIVVRRARVSIDLGGIAKGYAIDRAIDALQAAGCSEGIVNAGGDLRVFGSVGRHLWVRTRTGTRPITLRDGACAVSDPLRRMAPTEHRGYYHRDYCHDDPSSIPLPGGPSIVLAPTAVLADALTKCVLLARQPLDDLLSRFGATTIEAILAEISMPCSN